METSTIKSTHRKEPKKRSAPWKLVKTNTGRKGKKTPAAKLKQEVIKFEMTLRKYRPNTPGGSEM
jgi:hypothetical protein